MNAHNLNDQILSLITPDPFFPQSGMVRMLNRVIRKVAEEEGFLPRTITEHKIEITDEQRIVVKIMFNRSTSIFLKRVGRTPKQVFIYLHKDGVVSAEKANDEETLFHYFVSMDDCISYYVSAFIPNHYELVKESICLEVPCRKMFFLGNGKNISSKLVNASIVNSLKESLLEFDSNINLEIEYLDELMYETESMIMIANSIESLSLLSLTYCKNCIWAVYPYNKNNAKIKAIDSVEAQNKFCEFLVSCWEDGVNNNDIGK